MSKKLEYYTIKPNLKQIFGRKVTKNLKFDEWTDSKNIHQTLDNLTLITIIKNESEYQGIKSIENTRLEQKLPEGTILIWDEQMGYIIPQCQVCELNEIKEEIEEIQKIYKGD